MVNEWGELHGMNKRAKQFLVGDPDEWMVFVPIAVGLALLFYLVASLMGQEIVNLVPEDLFDLVVVTVSVVLGVRVGYSKGGFLLSLFVVATIWFGSVHYGAMQSASDVAPPGVNFVFFVAIITAIVFGIPAYALGRLLRGTIGFLRDRDFIRPNRQ